MKSIVRLFFVIHGAVLALAALGAFLVWGGAGALSAVCGGLSFSVPAVAFSLQVKKASDGEQDRFWARFMVAELLKWGSSAALLALCLVSGAFLVQPLMAGFFVSVLVQVFLPIFMRRGSES